MFGRETQGNKISPPAPSLSCGLCVISRQTGLSAYGWSMCLCPKTEIGSGWQAEKNLVGRAERGYNGCATNTTINRQGDRMVRHTVFGFKLAYTEESMTAHGGVALLAECTHGLGLCPLVDRHVPWPGRICGAFGMKDAEQISTEDYTQRAENSFELPALCWSAGLAEP